MQQNNEIKLLAKTLNSEINILRILFELWALSTNESFYLRLNVTFTGILR